MAGYLNCCDQIFGDARKKEAKREEKIRKGMKNAWSEEVCSDDCDCKSFTNAINYREYAHRMEHPEDFDLENC